LGAAPEKQIGFHSSWGPPHSSNMMPKGMITFSRALHFPLRSYPYENCFFLNGVCFPHRISSNSPLCISSSLCLPNYWDPSREMCNIGLLSSNAIHVSLHSLELSDFSLDAPIQKPVCCHDGGGILA
jgi:hypothetical protein